MGWGGGTRGPCKCGALRISSGDPRFAIEVADSWGLLAAAAAVGDSEAAITGVLVRPDGMVAAVGGPEVIRAWLAYHVV